MKELGTVKIIRVKIFNHSESVDQAADFKNKLGNFNAFTYYKLRKLGQYDVRYYGRENLVIKISYNTTDVFISIRVYDSNFF